MSFATNATDAQTGYGHLATQSDATADHVTDGAAVTSAAAVMAEPNKRLRVMVFNGDAADPAHELAKGIATRRFKEGIVDLAFPILKVEDIHDVLQNYALVNQLQPPEQVRRFLEGGSFLVPDDDPGFVQHLSVLGHGAAGTDTKEPFYAFGKLAYETSDLRTLAKNGLDLSRYMRDQGRVVLEGCKAGQGDAGKQYMLQVGRVFFGKKSGQLVANTADALGIAGEIVGGQPRELAWKRDFADELAFLALLQRLKTWLF